MTETLAPWLLSREPFFRLGFFVAVLAVMAVWEVVAERRELAHPRRSRWFANLGLATVSSLVVRLLFPSAAVGFAVFVEGAGWGLLPRLPLPYPLVLVVTVVVFDLAIYLQHVLFHAVPALWRLHMVHHADQAFDVTTGVRFHPIEISLSEGIKLALIAALGPPAEGVFLFVVLLNATSMFNHGNVRLPARLDRWLRWILVTPDMHRVHHSVIVRESNSNFGFNLPWWDRLFGTYRAQPEAGHDGMTIGVDHIQPPRPLGLARLLALPFRRRGGSYAISDRYARRQPAGEDSGQESSEESSADAASEPAP